MSTAQVNVGGAAFLEQHREDLARGSVAEELAERLLVIRNAMTFDHRNKIARGVAAERGLAEVRVAGDVTIGQVPFEVGEVA
jgi:hypothetical protein